MMRPAGSTVRPERSNRGRREGGVAIGGIDVMLLLLVAAFGVLQAATPFGGDQALFALGGHRVDGGAVLYRDFWDLKQPGIFWFYALAGRTFGFDSVGIHAFELLYMLAFCAVLIATLRPRFAVAGSAALAAFISVGIYYAVADAWELTQVEALAAFPLYMAVWCAAAAARAAPVAARRFAFAAGVAGAAAVLLKFIFIVIIVCAWLPAATAIARGERRRTLPAFIGCIALGLCAPLAAVAVSLAVAHAGYTAWATTFDIPRRIAVTFPHQPLAVLAQSVTWLLHGYWPAIVLAAWGCVTIVRRERDPLMLGLLAWLAAGSAIFLAQRQSWWTYQTLLVVTPVGVLAAVAFDRIVDRSARRGSGSFAGKRAAVAVAVIIAAVTAAIPVRAAVLRAVMLAHYGFALAPAQRADYARAVSVAYRDAFADAAFLTRPQALPGPIYVCGDPLIYTISGRTQAGSINGWLLELLLPEQWIALVAQLDRSRPVYLYVWNGYAAVLPRAPRAFTALIAARYRVAQMEPDGVWYQRMAAASPVSYGRGVPSSR